MNGEEKRLDDLRSDVNMLRKEVSEGLRSLEDKIDKSRQSAINRSQREINHSNREIEEIHLILKDHKCKIEDIDAKVDKNYSFLNEKVDIKFNKLDKKLFNLFLIGNGIGIAVGTVATMVIQAMIERM